MKKELFIPLAVLALTIVFAVICLLVYLTNGKPSLINKKMKIGALLLTLNAMVTIGVAQEGDTLCYLPLTSNSKVGTNYFGPDVSYNRFFNINAPLNNSIYSPNNINRDINANGYSVGIDYEQYLFSEKSPHSILLKIGYSAFHPEMNDIIIDQNIYTKILTNYIPNASLISYKPEINIATFNIGLIYHFKVLNGFILGIGPGIKYYMRNDIKEKYELTANYKGIVTFRNDLTNTSTENNDNSLVIFDGKPDGINNLKFNLTAELAYDILVSHKWNIIPYIGYTYDLTNVNSNTGWKINSLNIGIFFR